MPKVTAGDRATEDAVCGCAAHSTPRKPVTVDPEIKTANLKRLRRIEGQIRGLQRMVEEDRYCTEIVIQISSVQEALRGIGRALLRNHLRHCTASALKEGGAQAGEMYDELLELVYKHLR